MANRKEKQEVSLSRKDIIHIASLANLSLTDEEISMFQGQLNETLAYVAVLDELETKETSPTSQVTGLKNVTRVDETKPSLSQEQALSGTKSRYKGYFKIKAVIEK